MPMWFALEEDGAVVMTTFTKSQKILNIKRDPRVSLLAEAGETYSELQGVVIYGNAEIDDEVERIRRALEIAEGNRERAASMLGMSRTTLWRRMKEGERRSGR